MRKEKIICGRQDIFQNMSKSFALLQKDKITVISNLVQNLLQSLRDLLGNYFPDLNDFNYKLIRNLSAVDSRLLPHSLQDDLVELLNDSTAKNIFESSSLQKFWSSMVKSFPLLSKKCVESLLLFLSTYCCEPGFSTMCIMKTSFVLGFSVKNDLPVWLSKKFPRIDLFVKQSQAHPSH